MFECGFRAYCLSVAVRRALVVVLDAGLSTVLRLWGIFLRLQFLCAWFICFRLPPFFAYTFTAMISTFLLTSTVPTDYY